MDEVIGVIGAGRSRFPTHAIIHAEGVFGSLGLVWFQEGLGRRAIWASRYWT